MKQVPTMHGTSSSQGKATDSTQQHICPWALMHVDGCTTPILQQMQQSWSAPFLQQNSSSMQQHVVTPAQPYSGTHPCQQQQQASLMVILDSSIWSGMAADRGHGSAGAGRRGGAGWTWVAV